MDPNMDDGPVSIEAVLGYGLSQFMMKAAENPVQRLLLVMTVRREVERQSALRIPTQAAAEKDCDDIAVFEPVTGLFPLIRRIAGQEGLLAGPFRGLLTDACFSVLCFANDIFAQMQAAHIVNFCVRTLVSPEGFSPLMEVMFNVSHSALVMALTIPTTAPRETILTHLSADIPRQHRYTDETAASQRVFGYSGPIDCFRRIYRASGIWGFYQGAFIGTASMIVYRSIYYGAFSTLSARLPEHIIGRFQIPIAFALTVASGLVTQPFEVLRRRMMLAVPSAPPAGTAEDSGAADVAGVAGVGRYEGICGALRSIVSEGGYGALYSGISSRIGFSCCLLVVRVFTNPQ